jgi:hypothetical protein
VFTKKGRFKKADVTKQNEEYTPTVNTLLNIIKNKFPDMFAKEGKFEKAGVTTQNAEYTPTVNTLVVHKQDMWWMLRRMCGGVVSN